MYGNILIATDGSEGVETAIVRALDLARTEGARIHALHVLALSDGPRGETGDDMAEFRRQSEKHGRAVTKRITERATEHDLEHVRAVEEGVPYRVILEYIEANDIDMAVMGTTGGTDFEPSRLGSTTQRVIPRAQVPVLAVPSASGADIPDAGYGMYDEIVVPTDGSDPAARAADHAFGIAERYGADLHLIYVLDDDAYDFDGVPNSMIGLLKEGGENVLAELAADARERNLPVTTHTLRGQAHEKILEYADGVEADLVAMGSHGLRTGGATVLGSTTARTVRRTPVPVLTTR